MGWYVFDNTRAPSCPHCGAPHQGTLPVLNLYSSRQKGRFHSDNHRLMVWDGQSFFPWHASRKVFPNEHLDDKQKRRVGYFQQQSGAWHLVNEGLPGMKNVQSGDAIPIGGNVALTEGAQILLDPEDGGRLIQVQLANGRQTLSRCRFEQLSTENTTPPTSGFSHFLTCWHGRTKAYGVMMAVNAKKGRPSCRLLQGFLSVVAFQYLFRHAGETDTLSRPVSAPRY
jgi:hypothetical protein